jgi:hypothetical protein
VLREKPLCVLLVFECVRESSPTLGQSCHRIGSQNFGTPVIGAAVLGVNQTAPRSPHSRAWWTPRLLANLSSKADRSDRSWPALQTKDYRRNGGCLVASTSPPQCDHVRCTPTWDSIPTQDAGRQTTGQFRFCFLFLL